MPWNPSGGLKNITHVATTSTVAVAATGGPGLINDGSNFTVLMPANAEGYELVINPTLNGANTFACDVEVDHIDSFTGQILASELFTTGNWAGKGGSAATLRGKLFGDTIALTVTNAPNAFIQGTPLNLGGTITGSPIFINILALPDYYPAVARVLPVGLTANPIGQLFFTASTAVAAAGNTVLNNGNCLAPYHGPVSLALSTNNGGGFTGKVGLSFYSVTGGATVQAAMITPAITVAAPYNLDTRFPALICQAVWTPGAAVAGTINNSATGQYD